MSTIFMDLEFNNSILIFQNGGGLFYPFYRHVSIGITAAKVDPGAIEIGNIIPGVDLFSNESCLLYTSPSPRDS